MQWSIQKKNVWQEAGIKMFIFQTKWTKYSALNISLSKINTVSKQEAKRQIIAVYSVILLHNRV